MAVSPMEPVFPVKMQVFPGKTETGSGDKREVTRMDLQHICTNCLMGTIRSGRCTNCHKSPGDFSKRISIALPERYILANQYYLGRVIGSGGFGITYLAWDCVENRRLLVKELYPRQDVRRDPVTGMVRPVPGQEDFFEKCKVRFREEAEILYDFRSEPSVVDVYRLMQENNTVYYSMEFLTGFDLRSYIDQKGRLAWPHLSGYVKSILRTLRILHKRGLIHRDISPDNIFLTTVTEAKLIDFGSVRRYNSENGLTTILKQVYAPIEQYFMNGNQGPWTDIYSLSVTMYYALSGQKPPSAPERSMEKKKTIPIGVLCPELPANVAEAITKGMSVRAADRYPDVEEMARGLFPNENIFKSPAPGGSKETFIKEGKRLAFRLKALTGLYAGQILEIRQGGTLSFGRDRQCTVCYPPASPGVSRHHFTLRCDSQDFLLIRDEHSSYGTFVSGYRLQPGQWYKVERGSTIGFAGESYYVE